MLWRNFKCHASVSISTIYIYCVCMCARMHARTHFAIHFDLCDTNLQQVALRFVVLVLQFSYLHTMMQYVVLQFDVLYHSRVVLSILPRLGPLLKNDHIK